MRGCVWDVHADGAFSVLTDDGRLLKFQLLLDGGTVLPTEHVAWDDDSPFLMVDLRNLSQHTRFSVGVVDGLGVPWLG